MTHSIEPTTNGAQPRTVPPAPTEAHRRAGENTSNHSTTKEIHTMSKATIDAAVLGQFCGTESYYNQGPLLKDAVVTDGVHYLMTNGMAWLCTDVLAIVTTRETHDGFFMAEFVPHTDGSGSLIITDGNNNEIYRQRYLSHAYPLSTTLRLFAEWGEIVKPRWVLLLASEH